MKAVSLIMDATTMSAGMIVAVGIYHFAIFIFALLGIAGCILGLFRLDAGYFDCRPEHRSFAVAAVDRRAGRSVAITGRGQNKQTDGGRP